MHPSLEVVETTAFDKARMCAIDSYASLEIILSTLLATLLQIPHRKAAIIFFRIVNTRSRCAILSELLRDAHGEKHTKLWASIEKELKFLDGERNKLVHWAGVVDEGVVGGPNPTPAELKKKTLIHPKSISAQIEAKRDDITIEGIDEFRKRCSRASAWVSLFANYLRHPAQTHPSLQHIFQQPISDQNLAALHQPPNIPEGSPPPPQSFPE